MRLESPRWTYLLLICAVVLGAMWRFWRLAEAPLWLDETITALFSLGRGYDAVPLETVFRSDRLPDIFTFHGTGCRQVAHLLATQSTHPPLYFCLSHQWLSFWQNSNVSLPWQLRSLPALLGLGAIAAIFWLGRATFGTRTGAIAAAVMAVSPFTVYLSREARQYTLVLVLVGLALRGAIALVRQSQFRWQTVIPWVAVNSLGCYIHYFFILAFIAQLAMLAWFWRRKASRLAWLLSIAMLGLLSYLPWLNILLEHSTSEKTDWLPAPNILTTLYQFLLGWILTLVAFPVERQPLIVQLVGGTLMLAIASLLIWQTILGWRRLLNSSEGGNARFLSGFIALVLGQYLAIILISGKDITVAPRYNCIYYPALCVLVAASLEQRLQFISARRSLILLLLVGNLSSLCVCFDLAFKKPYLPDKVARDFNQSPQPLLVMAGYRSARDIALALSYAIATAKIRPEAAFVLLNYERRGYTGIWQQLEQTPIKAPNLWIVAPGLRQREFPATLKLGGEICDRDPNNYYRIGIPYQGYQC